MNKKDCGIISDKLQEGLTKAPGTSISDLIMADLKKTSALIRGAEAPLLPLTQNQMAEKCKEIRENVDARKDGNIEFDFTTKTQMWKGDNYRLNNVWMKAKGLGAQKSESLSLKPSDTLNAIAFVGGDTRQAFIATREAGGEGKIFELDEFHALSVDVSDANRESGVMTSFNKKSGIAHVGIIAGSPNLEPIKSLLLDSNPMRLLEENGS